MGSSTSMKDLERRLNQLYRQKLLVDGMTYSMLMFFIAMIAFFGIFLMDYMTDFPMILRIILTVAIFLICAIFMPRKRSKSIVKNKNIMQITCEVESRATDLKAGGFHSILISAIEFTENPKIGGSQDLKTNVINDSRLPEYNPTNIKLYNRDRIKLMLRLGVLMLILYIAWGALGHHSMLTFFKRAVGLNSLYKTNTQITSIEAPEYLAQFEDVPIVINVAGKRPASGQIVLKLDNGEGFDVALIPDEKDPSKYVATVKQAETSFKFYVEIGDAYRQKRYVEVIPAPVVTTAKIKVMPPKYTKLPVRGEKFGPLEFVQGSKVSFEIKPDRAVKNCALVYDGKDIPMKKTGEVYKLATSSLQKGGTYSIKLEDDKGIVNNKRLDFPLSIITDRAPSIEVEKPSEGTYYAPISRMFWEVSLSDDYGLAELILKYIVYKQGTDTTLITVKKGTVSLRKFNDEREAKVGGVYNLKPLKLEPGQILGVEFVIKDHKPARKDSEHGTTGMMKMHIVSAAELKQIIESEMIGLKNMMQDIQTDIKFQSKRIQIFRNKRGGRKK